MGASSPRFFACLSENCLRKLYFAHFEQCLGVLIKLFVFEASAHSYRTTAKKKLYEIGFLFFSRGLPLLSKRSKSSCYFYSLFDFTVTLDIWTRRFMVKLSHLAVKSIIPPKNVNFLGICSPTETFKQLQFNMHNKYYMKLFYFFQLGLGAHWSVFELNPRGKKLEKNFSYNMQWTCKSHRIYTKLFAYQFIVRKIPIDQLLLWLKERKQKTIKQTNNVPYISTAHHWA